MTYIVAFRGTDSVVFGADTQETIDVEKYIYSEKIKSLSLPWGNIVVGGAGVADLCDAFVEAVKDETKGFKPASMDDVEAEMKRVLKLFYEQDVAQANMKARKIGMLIACGVPKVGVSLWKTLGQRLVSVPKFDFVGFDSTVYRYFAKRLASYPACTHPSQMVLAAAYLLAIAKETGDGVSGDSQIVVLRDYGACEDPKEYTQLLTDRISEFNDTFDPLYFLSMDLAIRDADLHEMIKQTENLLMMRRHKAINDTAQITAKQVTQPSWRGDLYPKLPPDVLIVSGDEVLYPRVLGREPDRVPEVVKAIRANVEAVRKQSAKPKTSPAPKNHKKSKGRQ